MTMLGRPVPPPFLLFALAAAAIFQCTGAGDDGERCAWCDLDPHALPEEVQPACDPDGLEPCPEDFFVCVEEGVGGKRCEGQLPVGPDDGDWDCQVLGSSLLCDGDHLPEDAEGWDCDESVDGSVSCEGDLYVPMGGEEELWVCEVEGEFLICEYDDSGEGGSGGDADTDSDTDIDGDIDDGGSEGSGPGPGHDGGGERCPPGVEVPSDELCGDGIDNDCDGETDETCPGCLCVAGAWRYCDTGATTCNWGIQYCDDDGLAWGPCNETADVPAICVPMSGPSGTYYSTDAEACCIAAGFCCQDYWDRDGDLDHDDSLGDCTDIVCVPASG